MQRCPLCKTRIMIFGGMVAKDGAICSKCYDNLLYEKKLNDYNYKNLCINELELLLSTTNEKSDINAAAENLINKRASFVERFSPVGKSFCSSYANLFKARGIPENAEIQNSVTQFLWHKLVLKKNRLDKKGIRLESAIEPSIVRGKDSLIGLESFDGKYEVGTVRETVQGTECYYMQENKLHEKKDYSVFRFRTLKAHHVGKNKIICPSCGAESTRSNLLDGCDYCGTKFFIEDLGLRISDFRLENDYSVTAGSYFYKNDAGSVAKKIGTTVFILLIPVCLINILHFFEMLIGSLIIAALAGLVGVFFYEILIKPLRWFSLDKKGENQLYKRELAENRRNNEKILKQIQEFDPLFSYEGFYSEVENMLAVMHYAEDIKQVQAFWNNPKEQQIQSILNEYNEVIDMQVSEIYTQEYEISDGMQHLSVNVVCNLLYEHEKSVYSKSEILSIMFVKNENCKTHSVCEPSFLTCSSCGASLSLMEGVYCHYCGKTKHLGDIAWAIESYTKM